MGPFVGLLQTFECETVPSNSSQIRGSAHNSNQMYAHMYRTTPICNLVLARTSSRKMATAASACQKLLTVGTKIIGVGRNFAAHAKELGNSVPKVLYLPPFLLYVWTVHLIYVLCLLVGACVVSETDYVVFAKWRYDRDSTTLGNAASRGRAGGGDRPKS